MPMPKLPDQLRRQTEVTKKHEDAIRKIARERDEVRQAVEASASSDDNADTAASGESPTSSGDASASANPPEAATSPQEVSEAPFSSESEAPSESVSQEDPDSETWEQRYRVLNGKYVAEVPRMSSELSTAQAQIAALKQRLEQMEQASVPAPQAVPQAAPEFEVSARDVDEYGEDMVDFIKKIAKGVSGLSSTKIESQLESLTKSVSDLAGRFEVIQQSQRSTTANTMQQYLDAHVPNWQEQDQDPLFIEWLAQPDPMSGYRRSDMLASAYKAGQGARVAHFFQAYRQENEMISSAVREGRSEGTNGGRKPTVKLDTLATPAPAATGDHPAPVPTTPTEPERAISQRDIKEFYTAGSLGKLNDNPQAVKAYEREIMRAIREGRVQA